MELQDIIMFIVIIIFGCLISFAAGFCMAHDQFEERAVKEGKAEYYLDDNHIKQWRWK